MYFVYVSPLCYMNPHYTLYAYILLSLYKNEKYKNIFLK